MPKSSHNSYHNVNSDKYMVTCQERITKDNPTTNEWLTVTRFLKKDKKTDLQRVLEGILDKRRRVAIKIGISETIKKEFTIATSLKNTPGFIRPICFFECDDTLNEFSSDSKKRTSLCKGPGTALNVLILPYIEEGSVENYDWNKKSPEVLQSCMLQVLCSLLQAYETKGIICADVHMNNVLIVKTTKDEVEYILSGHSVRVKTYGYSIAIIDFEHSHIEMPTNRGRSLGVVYSNLKISINSLGSILEEVIVNGTGTISNELEKLSNAPIDPYSAWNTLQPLYTKLNYTKKLKLSGPPKYNPFVF